MKKGVIISMLLFLTYPLQAQLNCCLKGDYTILRDSIWLKNNNWKVVNLGQPKVSIDSLTASKIEFNTVPVYKFRRGINYYNYCMKFYDLIEPDTTRASGFIIRDSLVIGYLSGFQYKGKWFILPLQIFTLDEPLLNTTDYLRGKNSNELFEFYPFGIGSICYNLNDTTFIFNDHVNKFVSINEYIEKRISLDNLNKYYLESDIDRSNIVR